MVEFGFHAGEVGLITHQTRYFKVLRVFTDEFQCLCECGRFRQASSAQTDVDFKVTLHRDTEPPRHLQVLLQSFLCIDQPLHLLFWLEF